MIADTDVLIDYLNDTGAADLVLESLSSGVLSTTAISRFELLTGARTPKSLRSVHAMLSMIPTLAIDDAVADRAAEVRRNLDAAGLKLATADRLIAGVALVHSAQLLTRNTRHFERVPGLRLVSGS